MLRSSQDVEELKGLSNEIFGAVSDETSSATARDEKREAPVIYKKENQVDDAASTGSGIWHGNLE